MPGRSIVGLTSDTKRRVLISELDKSMRGLKCGCVCPGCGQMLIAKMGSKNVHHFSHYSQDKEHVKVESEFSCAETDLHLASKLLVKSLKNLNTFINIKKTITPPRYYGKENVELKIEFEKDFEIENQIVEKKINDIVCDIYAECIVNGKVVPVNFEICVSNPIGVKKKNKIVEMDITTIEIDVSGILGKYQSEDCILKEIKNHKNHTLIHCSKKLIESLDNDVYDIISRKNNEAMTKIDNWLKKNKSKYVGEQLVLPEVIYRTPLSINDKFGKKIYVQDTLPKKNNEKPRINVQSLEFSEIQNTILISGLYRKMKVQIPIFFNLKGIKSEDFAKGMSYLTVTDLDLLKDNIVCNYDAIFTWGRNLKVQEWNREIEKLSSDITSQNEILTIAKVESALLNIEQKAISRLDENDNIKIQEEIKRELKIKGFTQHEIDDLRVDVTNLENPYNCNKETLSLAILCEVIFKSSGKFDLNTGSYGSGYSLCSINDLSLPIKVIDEYFVLLENKSAVEFLGYKVEFDTPKFLISSYIQHLESQDKVSLSNLRTSDNALSLKRRIMILETLVKKALKVRKQGENGEKEFERLKSTINQRFFVEIHSPNSVVDKKTRELLSDYPQ